MSVGILVRVTTDIVANGERAWSHWIVATDNPAEAERAVRAQVPGTYIIKAADTPVLPETMQRLGLAPGQAWRL
jgi:hypothetical protein